VQQQPRKSNTLLLTQRQRSIPAPIAVKCLDISCQPPLLSSRVLATSFLSS
jgi:hypothetical protein